MTVTLLVYPSSWTNPEMETVCGQGVRINTVHSRYYLHSTSPMLSPGWCVLAGRVRGAVGADPGHHRGV